MMAVTTIFSGTLAATTASAWVAVPAANKYTVQSVGLGFGFIEFSVDGTNPFTLVTNQASGVGTAQGSAYTVNTPVLWARVNNTGTSSVPGILATIGNA